MKKSLVPSKLNRLPPQYEERQDECYKKSELIVWGGSHGLIVPRVIIDSVLLECQGKNSICSTSFYIKYHI